MPEGDLVRAEAGVPEQVAGPAQQQVAEQDRGGRAVLRRVPAPAGRAVLGLERPVRRRAAAARVGGVHVVVVHERAGVQQLERGARPEQGGLVGGRGDGLVAPPAEGRPEPLAARDAGARVLQQPPCVGAEVADPAGLAVDEVLERLLDVLAESGCVPRGVRRGHRASVAPYPRRMAGGPVRIADLARRLIAESERPVEIVYTGLRPGEKMHEVLFSTAEAGATSEHPLISEVQVPALDPVEVAAVPDGRDAVLGMITEEPNADATPAHKAADVTPAEKAADKPATADHHETETTGNDQTGLRP